METATAWLHLALFEPRIPPNTGNAIRTAAATGAALHLIEPLGFSMSDARLRRAGLDYHELASVTVHRSLPALLEALGPRRLFAFTTRAAARYTDVRYAEGDLLLFGPEPTGLPAAVLAHPMVHAELRLPMLAGRRSLNLSNAVAVAGYEAWRQRGFPGGR